MINADGSNLTFLTNSNDGNFYNPRLSLNGKKIVFIGDNGVYTINSDGLNIQQIISGGKAWAPSLSPNGEEIILENGNGLGFSIFKADGSFIMNLPTNGLNCTQPMFSPNGRDIAYICVDNNTGGSLRIMNSNGSNQRELFSGAVKVEYPAWSPDSQSIAFRMWGIISNQDQASDRIYKISIYGGKPIPLSPADIGSWEPSFSPDGKHIVFTRERYGDNQWVTNPDGSKWVSNYFQDLWIMNADGSNPIQLTDFYSGEPSWGP